MEFRALYFAYDWADRCRLNLQLAVLAEPSVILLNRIQNYNYTSCAKHNKTERNLNGTMNHRAQ